jgi:hypothetical protein
MTHEIAGREKGSPKQRWHAQKRAFLGKVAKLLGLTTGQRTISSNLGGPAVGGEVSLHTDTIYLWLKCPITGYGSADPTAHLYEGVGIARRCKGRKDYTGECNVSIFATNAATPERLAAWLRAAFPTEVYQARQPATEQHLPRAAGPSR